MNFVIRSGIFSNTNSFYLNNNYNSNDLIANNNAYPFAQSASNNFQCASPETGFNHHNRYANPQGDSLHNLRIVQWNCRGLNSKLPEIETMVPMLDILCVQETLLKPLTPYKVRGFQSIRRDITGPELSGVVIFIRNELDYKLIDFDAYHEVPIEIIGIQVVFPKLNINIINIYVHPTFRILLVKSETSLIISPRFRELLS